MHDFCSNLFWAGALIHVCLDYSLSVDTVLAPRQQQIKGMMREHSIVITRIQLGSRVVEIMSSTVFTSNRPKPGETF